MLVVRFYKSVLTNKIDTKYLFIGRHCCLWCTISSDQMKIARHIRERDCSITLRSLSTLAQCYNEFLAKSGGNLKKAKFHNNVINEAFFDIPLSQVNIKNLSATCITQYMYIYEQVCPPGLHITLGIFQRLFNLLEAECNLLDEKVTAPCDTGTTNSFDAYLKSKEEIQNLEDEKSALTTESEQAQQLLVLLLLNCPDPQNNPQINSVANVISQNTRRISVIVIKNV